VKPGNVIADYLAAQSGSFRSFLPSTEKRKELSRLMQGQNTAANMQHLFLYRAADGRLQPGLETA